MRVIADSGVFEKDGVVMYAKPKSAAYVERGVTTIFDDSATTADKQA